MDRPAGHRIVGGQRIAFANTLRGIAALSVVWLHLGVAYWHAKGAAGALIGLAVAPPDAPVPWWARASQAVQTLGTDRHLFDFGAFGVAVFFLLSGFVIPMSVVRLGPARFIASRIVRIYPVYLASLSVWLLVRWGLRWAGIASADGAFDWGRLAAQALLVSSLVGAERIDPVSWTLEVEVLFYGVVALMHGAVRRHRLVGVGCVLGGVVVVATLIHLAQSPAVVPRAWHAYFAPKSFAERALHLLAFVGYVFAGYVLHLRWLGHLRWPATIAWLAGIEAVTVAAFVLTRVDAGVVVIVAVNQTLAMAAFVAMLVRLPDVRHPLSDGLAAVSFPLYTTHLVVGFPALALLDRAGLPAGASLATAIGLALAVAFVVHRWVERPSLARIARIGRRGRASG